MTPEFKECLDRQKHADIVFVALTLYREARGELKNARDCVVGIAFVIMNRSLHPKWGWSSNIMNLCTQPMQFSSLTDPKDKQLTTWPLSSDNEWMECMKIANDVINGNEKNPVGSANHYYDISIPAPKWADESKLVIQINKIKFYSL